MRQTIIGLTLIGCLMLLAGCMVRIEFDLLGRKHPGAPSIKVVTPTAEAPETPTAESRPSRRNSAASSRRGCGPGMRCVAGSSRQRGSTLSFPASSSTTRHRARAARGNRGRRTARSPARTRASGTSRRCTWPGSATATTWPIPKSTPHTY